MSVAFVAILALVWALVGAGALATAAGRARRAARRARPGPREGSLGPVLIVRPCAGDEPGLEERLVSVVHAQTSLSLVVRVAIADEADPARGAAEAACARLRAAGADAAVVVTGARGPNRKVGQIAAAVDGSSAPIVLWADSDVDLSSADLDALVHPLRDPGVGAVWAPPVERGPVDTVGDRASQAVLGGSMHAFVLLRHVDPDLLVGKLVAARRDALLSVSFATMTDVLGEDVELARRLRAHGLRVEAAPFVATATPRGRSVSSVIGRYARWIAMVRAQRPLRLVGYPLLLASTPLVLVVAAIGATASPNVAAAAAGLAIATRLAVASLAARIAGRTRSSSSRLIDAALADVVLLLAFVRALASRRMSWRGRSLRLDAGGQLSEPNALDRASSATAVWRSS